MEGETICGIGQYGVLQAAEPSLRGIFGWERVLEGLPRGTKKTWQDGPRGWGFPYKASRSYCIGLAKPAKTESAGCDWCMLGVLDRCVP